MSEAWYYMDGDKQVGPVTPDELRVLASNGTLKPTDLIWNEGWKTWHPAATQSDLFGAGGGRVPPPLPRRPAGAAPSGASYSPGFIYCRSCGAQMAQSAAVCLGCGTPSTPGHPVGIDGHAVRKSRLGYVLLGLFLGLFGAHNFYAGYTRNAVIQLLLTMIVGWLIIPLLAVAIWNLVEVCTVNRDASGHPFV